MYEFFLRPFVDNPFLANAFAAAGLVSLACAIVGSFVVLRGMAFIGDALAHGALPGIALASLNGLPVLGGALFGALLMIFGIEAITRKSRLSTDTAIGLLFVFMLAIGVIIVSRSTNFAGDLSRILFGDILSVTNSDLLIQCGLSLVLLLLAYFFRRPLLLLCFGDDEVALAGFQPQRYHRLLLFMIVITITISFRSAGTLLVFGLLLAPPAAAILFFRKLQSIMVVATLLGLVAAYLGLLASYHLRIAAAAAICLVAVLFFFILFVSKSWTLQRRHPLEASTT